MSWMQLVVGVAGLASMKAAIEARDPDEAARQGQLAGVAVVEQALGSDRPLVLAGIAAAAGVEGRAELIEPLARVATGPDRRTAIPASLAARTIARALRAGAERGEFPDDLARADLVPWRDAWAHIALDPTRWIELRITALDTASALDHAITIAAAHEPGATPRSAGLGIPVDKAFADRDPAFRRAAAAVAPVPLPPALRPALARVVASDADPHVALAAAQALCADLVADPPAPVLAALGAPGLARLQQLVTTPQAAKATVRDAARCLTAEGSPASRAAIRAIPR